MQHDQQASPPPPPPSPPSQARSLLFVFAHPDDESFMVAGTACKYAAAGVRTTLITATHGEEGKTGNPPLCTCDELPEVRAGELRTTAQVLGINHLHILNHRDGTLADAPLNQIRAELVRLIRLHRPQVVVTFDPTSNADTHPDHTAISRWTSDAIAAAADERWLPEAGAAHKVQRLVWTTPQPPWEVARRGQPEAEAGVDYLIDVHDWWQQKAAALRAHRTQHESINKLFFDVPDTELILSTEAFRQGSSQRSRICPLDDLFAEL